jgi:hypothetical protein
MQSVLTRGTSVLAFLLLRIAEARTLANGRTRGLPAECRRRGGNRAFLELQRSNLFEGARCLLAGMGYRESFQEDTAPEGGRQQGD